MNVSLHASDDTDHTKEKFWSRIGGYYCNTMTVLSNHTKGSLGHHWGTIQKQYNQWSGCVDQVNHAPPSWVPITKYGPIVQDL